MIEQPKLEIEYAFDSAEMLESRRGEHYLLLNDCGMAGKAVLGVGTTRSVAKKRAIAHIKGILKKLELTP